VILTIAVLTILTVVVPMIESTTMLSASSDSNMLYEITVF